LPCRYRAGERRYAALEVRVRLRTGRTVGVRIAKREGARVASGHWSVHGRRAGVQASAGWWGAEDLSVGGDPVGGDHVLGGGEGDAVRAEKVVQCALEFVLGVRGGSRLWPEVRRAVGSAPQLERHQVVELVCRGPVALPVGGLSQTFLTVGDARGWPDGGGVAAASAYRALKRGVGDVGVDGAGCAGGVR